MNRFNLPLRALVVAFGGAMLLLATGCPDKLGSSTAKAPDSTTKAKEENLQGLFDEAAKGVDADLTWFKSTYDKLVVTGKVADELANLKDSDDDWFFCKLMKLPAKPESSAVSKDFVGKLTEAEKVVNRECAGAKKALHFMVDGARSVAGDVADDADDIISAVVAVGNEDTIAVVTDKASVEKMLAAVNKKGDQASLTKVMKHAPSRLDNDVIAWSAANQAGTKVIPAVRAAAKITDAMLMTELAKVAAADTAAVKLYYTILIDDDAKAFALAAKPAAAGPKFANLLAKAAADDKSFAVWSDFFTKVAAGGGNVNHQVNLLNTTTPIADYLDDARAVAGDIPAEKQKIIALMVEKTNAAGTATVRTANSKGKLTLLLDSVLAHQQAALTDAIGHIDLTGDRKTDLFAWAWANRAAAGVNAAAGAVATTNVLLVDEASTGAAAVAALAALPAGNPGIPAAQALVQNKVASVKFLFSVRVTDLVTAKAVAAQAPTAAVGGDLFSHFLARLPADAEMVALWDAYLTFLTDAGGTNNPPRAEKQIVLNGAGVKPIQNLLDVRENFGDDADQLNAIRALLIDKGVSAGGAKVKLADTSERIRNMFTAVLAKKPALLPNVVAGIDPATQRSDMLAWGAYQLQDNGPVVAPALGAGSSIKDVVDATKAAANHTAAVSAAKLVGVAQYNEALEKQRTLMEAALFLYIVNIKSKANADTLAAEAPTVPSVPPDDLFVHFLAQWPANELSDIMWGRYLVRLTNNGASDADALAEIGRVKNGRTPFNILLGLRNKDVAENEDILKAIITRMVVFGNTVGNATVRLAAGANQVEKMLTAVAEMNNASLNQTIDNLAAPQHFGLFGWANANKGSAAEINKVQLLASDVALVNTAEAAVAENDAAVAAGPADPTYPGLLASANVVIEGVKYLYDRQVTNGGPGAAATVAATAPSSGGGALLFSNFLSKLPVDEDIYDLWADYFTKLGAGAATEGEINRAFGGSSPMKEVTSARKDFTDDADELQKLITLMVNQGNAASIKLANTEKRAVRMLNAVLAKGADADMGKVIAGVDNANAAWLGTWAGAHLGATMTVSTNALGPIFEAAYTARANDNARKDIRNALVNSAYLTGKRSGGRDGTVAKPYTRPDYDNAVAEVAKVVTGGFLSPSEITGRIYDLAGTGNNSRLLYEVLNLAQAELTANKGLGKKASRDRYLSAAMVKSLAGPIRALSGGGAGTVTPSDGTGGVHGAETWQAHVTTADNAVGALAIEEHVVRASITAAEAQGIDHRTSAGGAGSDQAVAEHPTWLEIP